MEVSWSTAASRFCCYLLGGKDNYATEAALALTAAIPGARVAYVDNDPVVIAHAHALLTGTPATVVIEADVRFPRDLMTMPAVRKQIDFDQPAALLLVAVLHFVADSDPYWVLPG